MYSADDAETNATLSSGSVLETSTYYFRDAQGNVMGVYEHKMDAENAVLEYRLIERNIYGSAQVGICKDTVDLNITNASGALTQATNYHARQLNHRQYSLSNHLGNVLTTLGDGKAPVDSNSDGVIDYYVAYIISVSDYSPFGVELASRTWSIEEYRNGFNGKELDVEGMGGGSSTYDYGFRIYNPNLGKFLSVDPLTSKYPELTTYQFASNTPIWGTDLDGLEVFYSTNGARLGQLGSNAQVRVVNENDIDNIDEYGRKAQVMKTAKAQKYLEWNLSSKNGESNYDFNANWLLKNSIGLSFMEADFKHQAATVYAESSIGFGVESKEEMYAIASVHQRNKIAYGANAPLAKTFLDTSVDKQSGAMQLSNAAMINALTGGFDYSNGADQWDGAEQAMIPKANMDKASNGKIMYKMNTMGWSISDADYMSWKSAVENKFGTGKFTVPQNKAAMHNYGDMTNKGKTRLNSTAQYGLTIFWKTK